MSGKDNAAKAFYDPLRTNHLAVCCDVGLLTFGLPSKGHFPLGGIFRAERHFLSFKGYFSLNDF